MKKKYYYDCWIQALYMMKEFDVNFFTKGHLDIESDFLEEELGFHLNIRDIYGKLANNNTKIYVAPESEHIFEPKEGDLGIERNLHSMEPCYFSGTYWFYENERVKTNPHQQRVNIIYRNGKHFFNPKEEN